MNVRDESDAQDESAALTSLVNIRETLSRARSEALSPGVRRALEMTDYYLFLAMTYLGFTDKLFPEEE